MTDQIAYQEYIQRRYNAFCKTVIRCAALDKILKLKRQWEREVSLDYLMNEKFVQLAEPEQTQEEIFRYYFLRQPQRVIGVHIGRTRSTAGRHIQIALRKLREEMERCRHE
ncbi:sigma-70 family RNA polymerase sigma factor [Clostridium sp. AF02-29]|uniref:sigma-70 family RNA polymerase sigma factor n=1 Tax=Clostridium sp. AF02-29 TaxID=2292993 RepID=UPI002357B372|nr:sigma-70 family RNA polymerase sigma factor [Clostridium sp. AF02-29]